MEEGAGGIGIFATILIVWLAITVYDQDKTIKQMTDVIQQCSYAVDDANSIIGGLNSQISDAQLNAWSDYDTMGDTLDELTTNDDTPDNPCIVPSKN